MAKLPPDPNQRVIDLERKVAELERVTRRDHPHNLRDHSDADLSQTANAEWTPLYNPLTGKWELGEAAAGAASLFVASGTGTLTITPGAREYVDLATVERASAHVTPSAAGRWALATGLYQISMGLVFDALADGYRQIDFDSGFFMPDTSVKVPAHSPTDTLDVRLNMSIGLDADVAGGLIYFLAEAPGATTNVSAFLSGALGSFISILRLGDR